MRPSSWVEPGRFSYITEFKWLSLVRT